MTEKKSKLKIRLWGSCLIIIATVISFIFANSVDYSTLELGALYNLFVPPVIGLVSLILFLLLSLFIKKIRPLRIIIGILCVYNIYVGFALLFGKDYWPLVI